MFESKNLFQKSEVLRMTPVVTDAGSCRRGSGVACVKLPFATLMMRCMSTASWASAGSAASSSGEGKRIDVMSMSRMGAVERLGNKRE